MKLSNKTVKFTFKENYQTKNSTQNIASILKRKM